MPHSTGIAAPWFRILHVPSVVVGNPGLYLMYPVSYRWGRMQNDCVHTVLPGVRVKGARRMSRSLRTVQSREITSFLERQQADCKHIDRSFGESRPER